MQVMYITPDDHGHFRLLPCSCGFGQPEYIRRQDDKGVWWSVCCRKCGTRLNQSYARQHDAQTEWNKLQAQATAGPENENTPESGWGVIGKRGRKKRRG